jgi:hypothetical protein
MLNILSMSYSIDTIGRFSGCIGSLDLESMVYGLSTGDHD